jgi:hypothetical protein
MEIMQNLFIHNSYISYISYTNIVHWKHIEQTNL